ncbi:Imm51 family immunity protein [Paenibacillus sp. S150]|uniref:Imm51 family immunity protein n=1 Tax=Paenibacillus sp. S150 TaxID=2749826 RepID=UPI001C5A5A24|nr:Imm51 family immunity protein [Paenibacillus sp. S150]MBW4085789.1 SMI1/KNR4 family protein [Paenibacillus sp. S150]
MEKNLLEQLAAWHEEGEYAQIADRIMDIPEPERDYVLIGQLGRALNNLDRYSEALEQLLSIAEQGKQDAIWHYRAGYAYYYLKQYEEAVREFGLADELEPGDEDIMQLLGYSRNAAARQQREERRFAAAQSSAGTAAGSTAEPFDFGSFWEDSDYALDSYVSEPPTDELIASIEEELGYKLPAFYIGMMKRHNGGVPRSTCFRAEEATSWAEDHVAITGIMGIGRGKSYSLCGELGSPFMIEEWGYPDIGVVFGDCPSAGHDVIMLDYRACGRDGEPAVIHVDQEADYEITFLAKDFESFVRGLVNEEVFDTSEADQAEDLRKVSHGAFSPLLAELCSKVTELDDIEGIIRTICTAIVEEKGHFSLHADERSVLLYDVQFWLYTKACPDTSRTEYLEAYSKMIAFGGEFGTGGYAPSFISDWLDERIRQGMIVEHDGALRFTEQAADLLLHKLQNMKIPDLTAGGVEPFILVEQAHGGMSVILAAGSYRAELLSSRADEGFEGNGYDWTSLAAVFLEEKMPELAGTVHFDPEADMFCAYSDNREAILSFAAGFKKACEDEMLISELFSRAVLD